ncbi:polymer-forming cytoskeletal protein [Bacillus sp. EAC]|uniref:polymer-forming cytoskeletal protein n=1 Tax=Bacillus sp. EAC TaxID=1978338 RepID=UPI000B432A97|nr:polymer-forming cytoskeletal protein [Bacillus sp. EAC]
MVNVQARQDAIISGSGTIPAGKYDDVRISGSGRILGDIICREVKVSGSAKFTGNVETEYFNCSGSGKCLSEIDTQKMSVSGSLYVDGKVTGGDVNISGSFKTKNDLIVKSINISGSMKTTGSVKAEVISVRGSLSAEKGSECEVFNAKGHLSMNGLLNAENVKITHSGFSYIPEIGGETIEISRFDESNIFSKLFTKIFNGRTNFKTDVIEASAIKIDYTTASIVRGDAVTIGQKCKIDLVEYTEDVQIHPSAKVKEVKKIEQ